MKNILFTLLMFTGISLNAQKLVMNDQTTDITFVTKFLAAQLEGRFRGVNGSLELDTNHLSQSNLKLAFSVATVTTSDNQFGPNLIQAECFNASKYPTVELTSTSITKGAANNSYKFSGQLKIKGKTKSVSMPFTAVPNVGGYDINFSFSFLKKAFGLTCTAVGKDFKVNVRAYAKKV